MRAHTETASATKPRAAYWGHILLERLHRLFAIIILLQLIQCFGDFWWEETYAVIYGVLAVTAVCEMAFTRWYGLRISLETAAAVLLSAVYSPFFVWTGWPDKWNDREQWNLFYDDHIFSLHPFVVLALAAVLLVQFMSWVGKNRGPMLSILVGSVGLMATVDSFFPYELWPNIAWVVSAGLGWLVVLHLRQLRERHPESWEALAQRPLELALPAVIVIGLLLAAGVSMPRAPALLEDPYTIWSESQGREVPSFAGEGGVLSGTLSIAGGDRGNASSGYGRDDRNIGGGFDFDYSPVMTVQTSRRSYWRGETKAVYTGKGWTDRRGAQLVPNAYGSGAELEALPPLADGVKTEKVTQTVTLLRKDRIPVLFGAGPISRVTDLESDNNNGLQWNAAEWELRWRQPARVASYSLESAVTMLDRDALRAVSNPAPESASINLVPYLQLPDTLPERVSQLAADVAAAGTNDYDKAALLEKYLKDTFPYNNQPDVSKQTSADVVDAFLFEIKEGYCDYFSSAFVVMARSLGIPARWVKGYTSGVDPAVSDQMRFGGGLTDPDGPGTYTVRNADAHSWAEVYFEGYGWIPFEPTSGFTVPVPVPAGEAPEPLPSTEPAATPETEVVPAAESNWRAPVIAGAAVILLAAAFVLLRKRRGALLWERIRYAGATPNQRIVREMEKLLKFMKRRGMKRESHETIRETFYRWGDKFVSLKPDFDSIASRFERARYGRDAGAETDAKDFEEAVERLRKAL